MRHPEESGSGPPALGTSVHSAGRILGRAAGWAVLGSLAGLVIPVVLLSGFTLARALGSGSGGGVPPTGTALLQEIWGWGFVYGAVWFISLPASLAFWAGIHLGTGRLLERWQGRRRRIAWLATTLVGVGIQFAATFLYLNAHPMC